ncbi:hypothetical protein EMPS_03651 [Entomortierella parvispora]|uniref:TLC domain-containing protein n=1 Tax=Entomortierella parvispora TaxID=205924 RepID=A0A9P3H724_9FUNG|nr:hypothetical protein EMPS_03651 [Entomortierella parvispora]
MASNYIPTSEQGLTALVCLAFHFSCFFIAKTFIPFFGKDRRNLSWVLTLVNAIVISIGGFYALTLHTRTIVSSQIPYESYSSSPGSGFYRYDIAYTPTNLQKLPIAGALEGLDYVTLDPSLMELHSEAQDQVSLTRARAAFYREYDRARSAMPWYHRVIFFDTRFQPADSPTGQFLVTFLAMYLITDLLCGIRYYKEKISFLAGWVHHINYIAISYYACVVGKESHSIACVLVIEVPTVVIGLGFLNKRLRNDMLFGATYMILRILFDFALMHDYIFGRPSMGLSSKMIGCYKSLLHVKFFYDWVQQQIRLRKRIPTIPGHCSAKDAKKPLKNETALPQSATDQEKGSLPVSLRARVENSKEPMEGSNIEVDSPCVQAILSTEAFVTATIPRRRVDKQHRRSGSAALARDAENHSAWSPIAVR